MSFHSHVSSFTQRVVFDSYMSNTGSRSKEIHNKMDRNHIESPYEPIDVHMDVSRNGGSPIAGWFIRENPFQLD